MVAGGWWVVAGEWWVGWWVVVVGGGQWLWVLVVGGSPVGNKHLSSCNIADMSKLLRTYIYIYIYIVM